MSRQQKGQIFNVTVHGFYAIASTGKQVSQNLRNIPTATGVSATFGHSPTKYLNRSIRSAR